MCVFLDGFVFVRVFVFAFAFVFALVFAFALVFEFAFVFEFDLDFGGLVWPVTGDSETLPAPTLGPTPRLG